MATDIEKEGTSCRQERSSNHGVTSKRTGNHGSSGRRKALALLQFFELVFALIAMMIGIHAYDKDLPNGEVPIITGGLTIPIVPIEIYLEHGEPKIFNHLITIGLDTLLLLLWAIWPAAAITDPRRNPYYYRVYGNDVFYDHRCTFILIVVLSVIEVILLISHIGVRVHQMRMEKHEKACLANATQAQQVAGGQGRELDVQGYNTSSQQPQCQTPSREDTNIEPKIVNPPGHHLRDFSPEALYQRGLQMTEEDAGRCREKKQIANSQSRSSNAAPREPTNSIRRPADATNKSIDPPHPKVKPTPEPANTTVAKTTSPAAALVLARDPIDPPQKSTEPLDNAANPPQVSTGSPYKKVDPPHITIESASPTAKPTPPRVTPINAQGGCGCVDGTEDVEIVVIRNGKPPIFDNGIHPLRMNPHKTTRKSPLREVESASDDWTPCG